MPLESLGDLFVDELRDLYNAETQLLKALPQMASASSSSELRQAFEEHLTQTEGHVQRLENIFQNLGEKPTGKVCKAMKGLVAEGEEVIDQDAEPAVKDAAIIAAAQRVEHYEIAGYGSARNFAKLIGDKEAAAILQETLDEEGAADKKLTKLADGSINREALAGAR